MSSRVFPNGQLSLIAMTTSGTIAACDVQFTGHFFKEFLLLNEHA
jgi:hypothetical protein